MGLSIEFCEMLISDMRVNSSIKAAIVEFYSKVFLNNPPLYKISKYGTLCFQAELLRSVPVDQRIFYLIQEKESEHTVLEQKFRSMNQLILNTLYEAFKNLP